MYDGSFNYVRIDFFVLAINATEHKVTTSITAAIEMSAALLNSGTFGVEVAEVVGLAEADAVGLDDADVVLTYTFPV